MSGHAAFWDNPDAKDDTPVIRHAPDAHNYHVPDQSQLTHMRGSKVGRFATIPAANHDGTSKGFDPTVAGPVHVDPDAPDGGVIFDPDSVRKSDINRAVAGSYYPHQAYYQLGVSAPSVGVGRVKQAAQYAHTQNGFDVDRGPNPHMPGAYVTPSAQPGRTGEVPSFVANGYGGAPASYTPTHRAQEELTVTPVPSFQAPAPVQAPQQVENAQPQFAPPPQQQFAPPPQPTYYGPPQAYQPPPMDPNMAAMMQGIVALQQTVGALVNNQARPQPQPQFPPTTGVSQNPLPVARPVALTTQPVEFAAPQARRGPDQDFDDEAARPIRRAVKRDKRTQDVEDDDRPARRPAEAEEPRQTLREYEAHDRAEPEGVIVGFETLNLKFVNGPIANKAKKQVVFEIPGAGKHMARFHDVIEAKECVVLVYDTRYEEGQQYEPPTLDDVPIILHVPHLKKSFKIVSMGFSYSFGVFDHIVLVKQEAEKLDMGDDDEEDDRRRR
jgi:hypothetical protein